MTGPCTVSLKMPVATGPPLYSTMRGRATFREISFISIYPGPRFNQAARVTFPETPAPPLCETDTPSCRTNPGEKATDQTRPVECHSFPQRIACGECARPSTERRWLCSETEAKPAEPASKQWNP